MSDMVEYWRQRCADKQEELDKCREERDAYAKQQAIAFAIDYAERKLTWLRELRQQPDPKLVADDRMDVRYDQFIENQNK